MEEAVQVHAASMEHALIRRNWQHPTRLPANQIVSAGRASATRIQALPARSSQRLPLIFHCSQPSQRGPRPDIRSKLDTA